MGGIGKSALSVNAMYQLAVGTAVGQGWPLSGPSPFDVVIFRSLRDAPSCNALLDDCLQVFSPQSLGQNGQSRSGLSVPAEQVQEGRGLQIIEGRGESLPLRTAEPTPTERRISILLSLLRTHRVLLVLDNLESLLEAGDVKGRFRPGFEEYEQL